MLEIGDLGFSSLVVAVVVSVLFQIVIGLICRSQWQRRAAREEEIRRLLALASEEDAKAEFEALSGYNYRYEVGVGVGLADSVSRGNYQCAVCYSPTTTRCKQCKAVRYCSGKCQIIHWRRGHKNECRPPEAGADFGQRIAEFESYDQRNENEGREFSKVSVDSRSAAKVSDLKDDNVELNSKADNSTNESSVASFSGISEGSGCIELSDDNSSHGSSASSDSEKLDEYLSNCMKDDKVGPNCTENSILQAERVSPKFASLVNSVDNFSSLNDLEPHFDNSNGHHRSTPSGLSNTGMQNGLPGEQSTSSFGFWEDALDSVQLKNNIHGSYTLSSQAENGISYNDIHLNSSLKFTENNELPQYALGTKEQIVFHDILPAKFFNDTATMLDKAVPEGSTTIQSPSLKVEQNGKRDDSYNVSDLLMSVEARSSISMQANMYSSMSGDSASRNSYKDGDALSSSCKRSNGTADVASAPITEKPKDSKFLPLSSPSRVRAFANEEEHSLPQRITTDKADEVQATCSSSFAVTGSAKSMNGVQTFSERVGDQLKGSMLSKHQSLGGIGDISKIYTYKGFFSYQFFVKLYTWKDVALHPCGLINCGNSCYANAVLQCLAFTPPLTAFFLQGLHSKSCANKDWCFMCEFESLILKAKEGNSPISPIAIVSQLRNLGIQLDSGKEEDAHEFLRYAIDAMQSVCLKESCEARSDSSAEETTLIGLTFGGYLQSKIRCTKCQGKSERHERMMDMTIEIEGDIGTLEGALRQFTEAEILDGENKYECSRCKSYEKAKKRLTILEAPNVLTIALKRFQSGKFGKLTKSIRFPEILDLAPYMSGTSDKSPIYRLFGVIVHLDVMNASFSGHYVCYVKNPQNKWFRIDDSKVTPVELGSVLAAEAYLLLYARCLPRAPRSIRSSKISSDPKHKAVSVISGGKIASLNIRSRTGSLGDLYYNPSFDTPGNIDNFYLQFHQLQKILEEDSSDSSSLFSSNSDEGSCSTDSTRDSSSAEDLSDYIFGDGVRGPNSSLRSSSDSDTSSSSSPLYLGKAPITNLGQLASDLSGACKTQTDCADMRPSICNKQQVNMEGARSVTVLHSDMTKQCRNLDSRSSCRETDSERLASANGIGDVKSVSFRKSVRERAN